MSIVPAKSRNGAGGGPLPVALWLAPAAPQRERLQEIITELAARYSAAGRYIPVFRPQATLCTGELEDSGTPRGTPKLFKEVEDFCSKYPPLSLRVRAPKVDRRRNQWSQFLFLPLSSEGAPEEALNPVQAHSSFSSISGLRLSTDIDDPLRVMLHVSLMYTADAPSSHALQDQIVSECLRDARLPTAILFDQLEVVTPRSGDWCEILQGERGAAANWDLIYSATLGST